MKIQSNEEGNSIYSDYDYYILSDSPILHISEVVDSENDMRRFVVVGYRG